MFYLIRSACLADCLVILVLSCQEAVRRQPRWPGHLREYSGVIIHRETCISLRLATDPAAVCVCVCVCQWDGLWRKRSGYPYTVLEWGTLGVACTDWTPLCHSDVFNPLEICLHPFSFPLALLVLLKAFSENDMEWWKGMCNRTQCTIKSHIFHRDRIEAEKMQTIKEALTYSYIILKRCLIMVAIKGCNIFIMFFSLSKKFLTFNSKYSKVFWC